MSDGEEMCDGMGRRSQAGQNSNGDVASDTEVATNALPRRK